MGLFYSFFAGAFSQEEKSWSTLSCLRDFIQGDIFCSLTWEPDSDDSQRCLENYTQEFVQCLRVDGFTSMGKCWDACVPDMLEEAWACEEAYYSGKISEREYLSCLMTASIEGSQCLSDCRDFPDQ